MGSKTISLDDDAYAKLHAAKRPGESFSDVVHRILEKDQASLEDFALVLDPDAALEVANAVAALRESDLERERQRLRSMGG